MITWALFEWADGAWKFCGLTPHDEKATEWAEVREWENVPHEVIALEHPRRRPGTKDVEVRGGVL